MVGFRTTFHTTVTTAIPADVDAKAVINAFHDHGFIITMQPIVTRYEIRDRDPSTGKLTYDVFENISLLPFGLWKYELQFTSAFTDKRDGTVAWIEAPMGFTSEAEYTVKPGEQWNGEGGGWVLEEEIETTCPIVFRWFVESTMVPVRQKMHEQVIDNVRQREKSERDREARRSETRKPTASYSRFTSIQPPFATDEDVYEAHQRRIKSLRTTTNSFHHQQEDRSYNKNTTAQRAQELLGPDNMQFFGSHRPNFLPKEAAEDFKGGANDTSVGYEDPGSHGPHQGPEAHPAGNDCPTAVAFDDVAAKAVAESSTMPVAYEETHIGSQPDDEARFMFRNDVQRCEGFITALSAHLKACKESGRTEEVETLANKLENLVDGLNSAS